MKNDRKGAWMQTYTNRKYWPADPRPEDVFLSDIAKALSNTCRFTGHVETFYSVAQHSVHVSELCEDIGGLKLAQAGLLHDAPEAYIGDWSRPLKDSLPESVLEELSRLNDLNMIAILNAFDSLNLWPLDSRVHVADEEILLAEKRDLKHGLKWPASKSALPWVTKIVPWSAARAEKEFTFRFNELF